MHLEGELQTFPAPMCKSEHLALSSHVLVYAASPLYDVCDFLWHLICVLPHVHCVSKGISDFMASWKLHVLAC